MDGTLIQAWASHKSFRARDGSDEPPPGGSGRNAEANWRGRRRSNETHASTTDPDARMYRKGKSHPAILACQGHALTENRSGLVVGAVVTHADGFGERRAALAMLQRLPGAGRKSLGADKAYDMRESVAACRERGATPHIARTEAHQGGSAIDRRTTRHASYDASQVIRKRIEEHSGWGKTVGRLRRIAAASSGRPRPRNAGRIHRKASMWRS